MGVAETSPSVPWRGGEGALETRWRARPDRLEWAQARGIDARLHHLGCTERESYQSCVRPRLGGTSPMPIETYAPLTSQNLVKKSLQEHP
jgi:hypothetical protein